MTAVSLTLRLNVNKFTTLTYYKPRIAPNAAAATNQGAMPPMMMNMGTIGPGAGTGTGAPQKTFMEDFQ